MGEAKRTEAARMNGYVKCCMNCEHWTRIEATKPMGRCRRYPPVPLMIGHRPGTIAGQVLPVVDTFFTVTPDTETCGEHGASLAPAIADRGALAKIGNMDSLKLEPVEGNAD